MAKETDLTIEILRSLQSGQTEIKNELRQIDTRIAAIEQHMAGFLITFGGQQDQLSELRQRIERIERRLEFSDKGNHVS